MINLSFLIFQLSRSSSLNIGSSDFLQRQQQQKFERVDMSLFHALNARLKQTEQRCRGLHYALQHQKRRTEQIMLGNTRESVETKAKEEIKIKGNRKKREKKGAKHDFLLLFLLLLLSWTDSICSSSEVVVQLLIELMQLLLTTTDACFFLSSRSFRKPNPTSRGDHQLGDDDESVAGNVTPDVPQTPSHRKFSRMKSYSLVFSKIW